LFHRILQMSFCPFSSFCFIILNIRNHRQRMIVIDDQADIAASGGGGGGSDMAWLTEEEAKDVQEKQAVHEQNLRQRPKMRLNMTGLGTLLMIVLILSNSQITVHGFLFPPLSLQPSAYTVSKSSTNTPNHCFHSQARTLALFSTIKSEVPDTLTDVLRDLDSWNVRYRPSTTRSELEDLWRLHHPSKASLRQVTGEPLVESITEDSDTETVSSTMVTPTVLESIGKNQAKDLSLQELLERLDTNEIRYEPRSTRQDLEVLWNQFLAKAKETPVALSDNIEISIIPQVNISHTCDDTTRQDETTKGMESRQTVVVEEKSVVDSVQLLRKSGRPSQRRSSERHARQFTQRQRGTWNIPYGPSVAIPYKTVQQTTEFVKSKADKVSRRAWDWWTVDDQGIRNAAFTYVTKEDPRREKKKIIEVEAKPIPRRDRYPTPIDQTTTWTTTVPQDVANRPGRARGKTSRDQTFSVRPPHPRSKPPSTAASYKRHVSSSRAASRSNLWSNRRSNVRTPLALQLSNPPSTATRDPPPPTSKPSRPIYSPYADQAGFRDENNESRDTLDKVGDYLADVADRIMWGKYDSLDSEPASSDNSTRSQSTPKASKSTHSRHWKDRMEERFDSLLGIHENGKYYDSWLREEERRKAEAEGTDAFSYARGRSSKSKRVYDRPIWEEEGTLWTLLFGRAAPGKRLQFRDAVDGEPGQLLGLVQIVLRTGLVGAGYACRWASVQGSIPQPFVVIAVSTAALCVRRNRLRTVLLVLLGLRVFGELLHGYVLGDDGWEQTAEKDSPIS
jgi:hypothetical protein